MNLERNQTMCCECRGFIDERARAVFRNGEPWGWLCWNCQAVWIMDEILEIPFAERLN